MGLTVFCRILDPYPEQSPELPEPPRPPSPSDPRDPLVPSPGGPRPIDPIDPRTLSYFNDFSKIYLSDERCLVGKRVKDVSIPPLATELAQAYVAVITNIVDAYTSKNYDQLFVHQAFGQSVLAEMMSLASSISLPCVTHNLCNVYSRPHAQIIEALKKYKDEYPTKDLENELPFLLSNCYERVIGELIVCSDQHSKSIAFHHLWALVQPD